MREKYSDRDLYILESQIDVCVAVELAAKTFVVQQHVYRVCTGMKTIRRYYV